MADFTADFEAGVNGATITNAGGEASATAWTSINGTPVYDNAHVAFGVLAGKYQHTASQQQSLWAFSLTEHWGRFYLYGTGNPGAQATIFRAKCTTGTHNAQMNVTTAGKLNIHDEGAGHSVTSTASILWNQWVRIEYHVIHSATVGFMEAKLFNTSSSTSPTETITAAASDWNTGATPTNYQFGMQGIWGAAIWLDNIVANATSYPGPFIDPNAVFNLAPVIYGRGAC